MSQPISPTAALEDVDPIISSPNTPRRKKKKSKEGRRRNSRPRGKGDLASEYNQGGINDIGSPLVSKDSPKKKKKGRKSDNLGCMIIPDIDVPTDQSARFSAVTDPTELLDEDDFTASTKDASTKDEKKNILHLTKAPKILRKNKKERAKTPDKKRSKTPDKKQRAKAPDKKRTKSPNKTSKKASLTRSLSKKGLDEKKNESWGDDPTGSTSYISSNLLNLLVGPETKPPSHDSDQEGTMPLKKSHSYGSSLEGSANMKKSSSYHSPHKSPQRKPTLRSKNIEDPEILDTKNATWGETRGGRGSCSPAVNPYISPYSAERESPMLRRNVKSFGSVESWRNDPKRDRDIPSILIISNDDASEPGFNESWDVRPSARMLKDTIERPPSMRARSAGAVPRRRRSSAAAPRVEKPPQPLRKKAPRRGSANATWEANPSARRLGNNKVPLSPGLVDILGVSPATTKKKSPGRFKNTMTTSNSLNSLKENFRKLRGGRKHETALRAVPML